MKAKGNFKLSKPSKMIMASMLPPRSHEFKRAMIQAELAAAIKPKSSKGDRNTADGEK